MLWTKLVASSTSEPPLEADISITLHLVQWTRKNVCNALILRTLIGHFCIAHIPFGVPELAEEELRRAASDGAVGFYSAPFIWSRKAHGHPDHHRIFAIAEELELPFGIHPSFEPHWAASTRFGKMTGKDTAFFQNIAAGNAIREGFTTLFQYGVFDLFPELRVIVLEVGAGWIGYWLERMD